MLSRKDVGNGGNRYIQGQPHRANEALYEKWKHVPPSHSLSTSMLCRLKSEFKELNI